METDHQINLVSIEKDTSQRAFSTPRVIYMISKVL